MRWIISNWCHFLSWLLFTLFSFPGWYLDFVCWTLGLTVLPSFQKPPICIYDTDSMPLGSLPIWKRGKNKAMVVYKNWPVCGDWRIAPRLAILNSPAHSPAYLGAPWSFPIDCCPQLQNSWAWFTEMDSSDPHRDPSRATTPKPRKQKLNGFWNLVTATRKWVSKFTPKVFQTPSTIISAGCKHLQFEYTYERPPRP